MQYNIMVILHEKKGIKMRNKVKKITITDQNGNQHTYVEYKNYKKLLKSYNKLNGKYSMAKALKSLASAVAYLNNNQKKYDEITIAGNTYFVLNVNEEKHEVTYCMKDVLSRKEMLKYFTDKWYQDSSDYCVRYNSDIRNNRFEDSYIYKILNSTFKEDKLAGLDVVGDVRLLTKEEVEDLDEEHRNINKWYWTMTPYNDMSELKDGSLAGVFVVYDNGDLDGWNVYNTNGVRPAFTLKTE